MASNSFNTTQLPAILNTLFEAKRKKNISFTELGRRLGRDEVFVASIFYGQVKPDKRDLDRLSSILDVRANYLHESLGEDYFPVKGSLVSMPPADPLLYRFYEILQTFGPAMKAVINEKFGDGIMSAIDYKMHIDKEENPNGDRVKVTMSGKFLPYLKF